VASQGEEKGKRAKKGKNRLTENFMVIRCRILEGKKRGEHASGHGREIVHHGYFKGANSEYLGKNEGGGATSVNDAPYVEARK